MLSVQVKTLLTDRCEHLTHVMEELCQYMSTTSSRQGIVSRLIGATLVLEVTREVCSFVLDRVYHTKIDNT